MFYFINQWIKTVLPLSPNHREKRWTGLLANTDDDIGELEESTKVLTERQHQATGELKKKSTEARDRQSESEREKWKRKVKDERRKWKNTIVNLISQS